MRKLAFLCVSMLIFAGCQPKGDGPTSQANQGNSSPKANEKKADKTPGTEKVDGDFVQSESGTEKAKPDAGKANVQGKALFNEKPAEGVEVRLCEKFSQYIGGCTGETFKTKTDANGEYLFANVTPRVYEGLLVSVFNTKNYIFATQGLGISTAKYKIDADKTFFAPTTNLFKDDLKVQNPKNNAKADAKTFEIKWDAYPDAAYYKLNLSPKDYNYESSLVGEKTDQTSYKVEKPLVNGEYTLKIDAYNANDIKLADSGDYIKLTVTGGAPAANPPAANK